MYQANRKVFGKYDLCPALIDTLFAPANHVSFPRMVCRSNVPLPSGTVNFDGICGRPCISIYPPDFLMARRSAGPLRARRRLVTSLVVPRIHILPGGVGRGALTWPCYRGA